MESCTEQKQFNKLRRSEIQLHISPSQKSGKKVRAGLFTLVIALLAMLAQAAAAHAQTGAGDQVGGLSSPPLFDMPCFETNAPASAGPAMLALADVAGTGTAAAGGLWLSGDTASGLAHLQWIAGNHLAGLLKMDRGGKVSFDLEILVRAVEITSEDAAHQRERIATFVRSDEGLRLLAEVTNGAYRILLHIGPTAPTLAGSIKFDTILNLDNLYDSRINPRRSGGRKMENECPPEGFDSLIAIHPGVYLFNVYSEQFLPIPQIAFHELAETQARLALDLDYLPQPGKPGAHETATGREIRLKQERPRQVVMPTGYNIRLVTRDDWLRQLTRLGRQFRKEQNQSGCTSEDEP